MSSLARPQMVFVYGNCSILIGDEAMRTLMLRTHHRLLHVMYELRMPAWRTETDFDTLDAEVVSLARDLRDVQLRLEQPWPGSRSDTEKTKGNCPGDGFDIPKVVEMLKCAQDIKRRGFCSTYSAGSKECAGVKQLKQAIKRTTRHRSHDFGSKIFCKAAAQDELIRQNAMETQNSSLVDDLPYYETTGVPGDSNDWPRVLRWGKQHGVVRRAEPVWTAVCDDLLSGTHGPCVSHVAMKQLFAAARDMLGDLPVCKTAFVALNAERSLTLAPSVCVRLADDTLAQVVCLFMTPNARGHGHQVLVTNFISSRAAFSDHPTIRMPWLKRRSAHVAAVPCTSVRERVHIVPVLGDLHTVDTESFVWNRSIFWTNHDDSRTLRPNQPPVYRLCPRCRAKVPQPRLPDGHIKCPGCTLCIHW